MSLRCRFCGASLGADMTHPTPPCEPFAVAERLAGALGRFLSGAERLRGLLIAGATVSKEQP